jgi:hypothetical protein
MGWWLWVATSFAQSLAFQGVLTDPSGVPASGTRSLSVSLYESAGAVTPFWDDTFTAQVSGGVFSLALGTGEALDLGLFLTHPQAWVTVSVDGVESPRIALAYAPYAAVALSAQQIGSRTAAQLESTLTDHGGRLTAVEGVNATQATSLTALDGRIGAAEGTNTAQGTSLTALDGRIAAAEGVNTSQAGSITALDGRITAAEGVNTSQAGSLTSLDGRITAVEGVNTTQASTLTSHATRLTAIETGNVLPLHSASRPYMVFTTNGYTPDADGNSVTDTAFRNACTSDPAIPAGGGYVMCTPSQATTLQKLFLPISGGFYYWTTPNLGSVDSEMWELPARYLVRTCCGATGNTPGSFACPAGRSLASYVSNGYQPWVECLPATQGMRVLCCRNQ